MCGIEFWINVKSPVQPSIPLSLYPTILLLLLHHPQGPAQQAEAPPPSPGVPPSRLKPLPQTDLPALVCGAVVGVVLGDVGVDAVERELLVLGQRDGLDDQLGVRVGRLGVVLQGGGGARTTANQIATWPPSLPLTTQRGHKHHNVFLFIIH